MGKLWQNKVAGSRMALPFMAVYAALIWLLAGAVLNHWWLQLACFATSCYLMMLLNNVHALIRIYSRMVTCTYIALSCTACFLFPSLNGAVFAICIIGSILLLYAAYQNHEAVALVFYAFALWGIGSIVFVKILWLIPLLWILMHYNLMAMSWRIWKASLLGILLPYWFWGSWLFYNNNAGTLVSHFSGMLSAPSLADYSSLSWPQVCCFALTALLLVTGIVHFLRQRSGDKIRTRMFFYNFMWLGLAGAVYTALFPQDCDIAFRFMVIFTAPLAAHFFALTSTKVTNVAFWSTCAITLAVTILNLVVWNN